MSHTQDPARDETGPTLAAPSLDDDHYPTGGTAGDMERRSRFAWAVTGSMGGSVAGRVAAGAVTGAASSTVNDYAASSRQKDELTLAYRLEDAGGRVLVEDSERRKAGADGEDLLTPVAQKASEAIAEAVAP